MINEPFELQNSNDFFVVDGFGINDFSGLAAISSVPGYKQFLS
jgi:hypothetical protein